MATLDDAGVRALLTAPNVGVISTLNADGSIHSAVVWVDSDDGRVAVNTAKGRVWPSNLERDPRATVTIVNRENPMEYVEIRGAAEEVEADADAHIDRLAKKYLGVDEYPWRDPSQTRVTFLITPERVRHAAG